MVYRVYRVYSVYRVLQARFHPSTGAQDVKLPVLSAFSAFEQDEHCKMLADAA